MAQTSFELKGPWAVVGLAIIIGGGVFKFATRPTTLDAQGQDVLQQWIQAEYVRHQLAKDDPGGQDTGGQGAGVGFLHWEDIQFSEVSVRGSHSEAVVKVVVEPHPAEPPGTPRTRYYEMHHSMIMGWSLDRETRAWIYRTTFF